MSNTSEISEYSHRTRRKMQNTITSRPERCSKIGSVHCGVQEDGPYLNNARYSMALPYSGERKKDGMKNLVEIYLCPTVQKRPFESIIARKENFGKLATTVKNR